ncbi:MAG: DUF386 domain-containing protein [Fretibacterium sp.]|nr:DUF386 domain-containing protein [Fretibacterium sp.]
MILGTLLYPSRYSGLGQGVRKGLDYLAGQSDLATLSLGRTSLIGDEIYLDVFEAETVFHDAKLFEAHERFVDIHVTLEGQEWYGYAPTNNLTLDIPYSPEKDTAFYRGEGVYFQVPKGQFVLFFPEDAHKPLISFETKGIVKKLILKVKI